MGKLEDLKAARKAKDAEAAAAELARQERDEIAFLEALDDLTAKHGPILEARCKVAGAPPVVHLFGIRHPTKYEFEKWQSAIWKDSTPQHKGLALAASKAAAGKTLAAEVTVWPPNAKELVERHPGFATMLSAKALAAAGLDEEEEGKD